MVAKNSLSLTTVPFAFCADASRAQTKKASLGIEKAQIPLGRWAFTPSIPLSPNRKFTPEQTDYKGEVP